MEVGREAQKKVREVTESVDNFAKAKEILEARGMKVNAADTLRPQVRVLFDAEGKRLALTYDLNLWDPADPDRPASIVASLDPANYEVDPLTLI